MEMQHDTLWNEAVAFTRSKSPASFEQWFSGVQYDGMTDGVVSLRARDEFVREWVDQHFLPTLVDYLRSQTGWSVQIAWSVGGELQRPVADGAAAASGPRTRSTSSNGQTPGATNDGRSHHHQEHEEGAVLMHDVDNVAGTAPASRRAGGAAV